MSAYYSEESIHAARVTAATQVAKVLTGQRPDYTVNAAALARQRTIREMRVLKVYNDFDRKPDLLKKFDKVVSATRPLLSSPTFSTEPVSWTATSSLPSAPRSLGKPSPCSCRRATLVDPLKALEMGQPGDVIVVDAGGDRNTSVCGGLMGGLAKNRGIRGMIVDGAGRDTDELEDINWPIWTRAITPRGTHTMFSGRKEELSINVPIACGGVVVNPGDFIVADLMGVVVIPQEKAEEVVNLAQEQADREEETRKWVAKGKTVEDSAQ
jgi:4-hydroxy-4-methyl-2-oxoglutarate aldolase